MPVITAPLLGYLASLLFCFSKRSFIGLLWQYGNHPDLEYLAFFVAALITYTGLYLLQLFMVAVSWKIRWRQDDCLRYRNTPGVVTDFRPFRK